MTELVTIVGAGLAGSEAAWQLAQAGIAVKLLEMKSIKRTPAQNSDELCELVCSNSLRSINHLNAIGLLKEEMRRLDSLIIESAFENRVPAGDALAVDRLGFSRTITAALDGHPNIERASQVVEEIPKTGHTIIATGPLTDNLLAASIQEASGADRLYFYDAIAPIVTGESLNRDIVFAASRYGKGGGDDYLNCPMNKEQYQAFIDAILEGECMPLHAFEEPKYFQGCLPIEVVATSGRETLRFGAMKPVGLDDPRTGRWPYAVLQLRKEDSDGQAYNMVGFQTKLKYPEQKRIFKMVPGLEDVEFVRLGAIHRNTTFELFFYLFLNIFSTFPIPITTCNHQLLEEPPITVKGYKNNVPLTLIYPWIRRRVLRKLHQSHSITDKVACQVNYANISIYYQLIGVGTKIFSTRSYDLLIRNLP